MSEVSRRDFLKSAGLVGVGAAVAGLAGCGSNTTSSNGSSEDASAVPYPVGVHEADVLVIGGGIAGCTAARRAMAKGASVIVVDKGLWGHSGTSGINWGHDTETNEWSDDDGSGTIAFWCMCHDGMPDQTFALALCQAVHKARPDATTEQVGSILERTPDNHPASLNAVAPFNGDHGCFPRYFAQSVKRLGAEIHDRTNILDVLLDEGGNVAGAVGLNLKTGEASVFRAKTVVMAMGSFAWISGWNGMSPYTIAGPENTGDGHRILIQKGLAMRDMEQEPFDNVQWTPIGIRQGMGSTGGAITNHTLLLNKNKERITTRIDTPPEGRYYGNAELMRLCVKTILDGDATENGGFYVDARNFADPTNNRYYRRCGENQMRALGYEMPDYVEVVPEQWETAGRPFNYSTTAETEIPGLFYAASGQGSWFGMAFFGAYGTGFMAGEGAADKAAELSAASAIPWDQVNGILGDAYSLLDAEPENGIRSTIVFRKIQEAYWSGLGPIRNEEGINATLAELDRIESEDIPKMFVPSKSKQMNSDWLRAIEAKSLITCARGVAQAALIRKETRGAHCRTDYPALDNVNWLKNTKVQLVDNAWVSEVVDIDDSIISKEILATIIPDFGIDITVKPN
ncbi:MAG: FAD-dependent oxidoreductase [Actinobacteria bacterium]|nr:FAD-dependent oxidoreductase [Actinomycetota bacterium]